MKFLGKVFVCLILVVAGVVLTKLGLVDQLFEVITNLFNK